MANKISIEHLKDRESYRKATKQGEDFKGFEQTKITNNIQKEIKEQEAWKTIASILLLAFVIFIIYLMSTELWRLTHILGR